jgi:ribosome-binding protein aMBF1 (putative translation factor)
MRVVLTSALSSIWRYCVEINTKRYRIRSGKDLGQTIAEARRERGLTQAEVIITAGATYDRTYLSRMESGEFAVQVDRALLILRALGVNVYAELDASDGR